MACHCLLRHVSTNDPITQGSNPGLLHCRQILYCLSHQGSPGILEWVAYPFSRGSANPGIELGSPASQVDSLQLSYQGPALQFSSVQSLSHVRLFVTPWTVACQAPLSMGIDSPDKKTGTGCHSLLQGIFPTQGSNPGFPHCRQILYQLSHQGSPRKLR